MNGQPADAGDGPLLEVAGLRVGYRGQNGGYVDAVRGVSFTVGREKVGIVGESGSGKSTIGRALLKLLPTARITADAMRFGTTDLLGASERDMLGIRGRRISMILQDPKFSLNPVKRVGDQVAEAYLVHHRVPRAEARKRAVAMLDAVQIRDPERIYGLYPHEVSGGMGQRIMIAMMLIPEPDLIIADEPTGNVDEEMGERLMRLFRELNKRLKTTVLIATHDLNIVRNTPRADMLRLADGMVVKTQLPPVASAATAGLTPGLVEAPVPAPAAAADEPPTGEA